MPHRYVLMPTTDETVQSRAAVGLSIYTDDDDLIQRLAPPAFRTGDAAIMQLLAQWREYALSVASPPEEQLPIGVFYAFLAATYGTAYTIAQRY